jgi:hypothetical protein
MNEERRYFTWGCQPSKKESVNNIVNKTGVRASTKTALLDIIGREMTLMSSLAGAKRAALFTCQSFDEIASLVDEIRELEQSLAKLNAICDMLKEV